MQPAAWGLDIGRSALKAVKLQKVRDEVEIVSVAHIEYGTGGDHHGEVRAALRTFLDSHTVRGDQIVVALPGRTAFSRFIKLPPLDVKKLDEIVRYEAQQQIPFPIQEVVWDYQRLDGKEPAPGEEIEVGIFAIKKDLIQEFLSDLAEVKINADLVTIAPLAIFNFIRFDATDSPESLIVVDVGANHTDLLVVEGNRFWIRNLPLAGDDLTKALMEKFQVPFEEAERLKRTAAKSPQAKKIFAVMEPVLKDFVGEIHRSIGYYKAQSRQVIFKQMILMGDASKLLGLRNYLAQELQLKVSKITKLNRMNLDVDVNVDLLRKHVGAFGTAMGLALQGIGEGTNNVNLVPQEVQQERVVASKKPFILLAAGIIAVFLLIVWWSRGSTLHSLELMVQEVEAEGIDQGSIKRLNTAIKKQQDLTAETERLQQLEMVTGDRLLPGKILDAVRRALPENSADMDRAIPALDRQQIIDQINQKKLWITGLDLMRVPPEDDRGEIFVLRVSGAVRREESRELSLAKVKSLFYDRLLEELTFERDGVPQPPVDRIPSDWEDWEDSARRVPLKILKINDKVSPLDKPYYDFYFMWRREILIPGMGTTTEQLRGEEGE